AAPLLRSLRQGARAQAQRVHRSAARARHDAGHPEGADAGRGQAQRVAELTGWPASRRPAHGATREVAIVAASPDRMQRYTARRHSEPADRTRDTLGAMRTRGLVIGDVKRGGTIAAIGSAAMLASAATACSTPDVSFTRVLDAADAEATGDGPAGFFPLHIRSTTTLSGFSDLTLIADPTMIDTTGLTINSTASSYFVQHTDDAGDLYAVLFTNELTVRKPV